MIDNLTLENFWDELYKKYPQGCQVFCDWIDAYKSRNNWDVLFNQRFKVIEEPGNIHRGVKFHDLPHAMQLGIWIEFRLDIDLMGGVEIDLSDFELRKDIAEWVEIKNFFILNYSE